MRTPSLQGTAETGLFDGKTESSDSLCGIEWKGRTSGSPENW